MQTFQPNAPVQGVIWHPGVQLPGAGQVDFAPATNECGTFPAHTLVVIGGHYRVVMPGDLVVYADAFCPPTDLIDALSIASATS